MVCIEPRIFFFVFERRDITAASKALRSFVRKERLVVRIDEILSCPSDHTSTLVTIHFQFAIIPCNVLNRVQSILANQSDRALPLLEEAIKNPPLGELAINKYVVSQLQSALASKGLEVVVMKNSLHVSRSSTSREDIAIYHKSKYVTKERICGGVFQQLHEQEEEEQENYDNWLRGAAGEPVGRSISQEGNDKKQLLSNMEKVAGELALKAGQNGKVFSSIEMYGFLFDAEGDTLVAKLVMNFVEVKSELYWSEEKIGFNNCMQRLCYVFGCKD